MSPGLMVDGIPRSDRRHWTTVAAREMVAVRSAEKRILKIGYFFFLEDVVLIYLLGV